MLLFCSCTIFVPFFRLAVCAILSVSFWLDILQIWWCRWKERGILLWLKLKKCPSNEFFFSLLLLFAFQDVPKIKSKATIDSPQNIWTLPDAQENILVMRTCGLYLCFWQMLSISDRRQDFAVVVWTSFWKLCIPGEDWSLFLGRCVAFSGIPKFTMNPKGI